MLCKKVVLEYALDHCHQDISSAPIYLQDLEKLQVRDGARYLFLSFGEWSNIVYLAPVADEDGGDASKLDLGGLFLPAHKLELELTIYLSQLLDWIVFTPRIIKRKGVYRFCMTVLLIN